MDAILPIMVIFVLLWALGIIRSIGDGLLGVLLGVDMPFDTTGPPLQ